MRIILFLLLTTIASNNCFAQLKPMTEDELGVMTGIGIGGEGVSIVYEDFQVDASSGNFNGDLVFTLEGIAQSEHADQIPVSLVIDRLYMSGMGSNYGENLSGNYVNLGRLSNPYRISMVDGNNLSGFSGSGWTDKAALSLAAPTKYDQGLDVNSGDGLLWVDKLDNNGNPVKNPQDQNIKVAANPLGYSCTSATAAMGTGLCSSRPETNSYQGERMDFGISLNAFYNHQPRDMNLNIHMQGLSFDGSYIRLLGGKTDLDGQGALDDTLMMEGQFNFYASNILIDSCSLSSGECTKDSSAFTGGILMEGVTMEIAIGDVDYYQPATLNVLTDGNFIFEVNMMPVPGDPNVPTSNASGNTCNEAGSTCENYTKGELAMHGRIEGSDPVTWNWFKDYYENGNKSNLDIQNMQISNGNGGYANLGATRMTDIQIHYLRVQSHDLEKSIPIP